MTAQLSALPVGWRPVCTQYLVKRPSILRATTEATRLSDRFPPRFGDSILPRDVAPSDAFLKAWASAFDAVKETPDGYWVEDVEGTIPSDLKGTYYRNGPGECNFLNEPVVFSFDADGIIGSVAIKDGRAFFRSRFVKTRESLLEKKAGKRLFRGAFGTVPKEGLAPFRSMIPRNAGNGKPIPANGRIYAPYEGCVMSELDAVTLETLYPKLPDGVLQSVLAVMHQVYLFVNKIFGSIWKMLSIKPKVLDPRIETGFGDSQYDGSKNLVIAHNYQMAPSLGLKSWKLKMTVFEIDRELAVQNYRTFQADQFSMLHSIGISDNCYAMYLFPMSIDPKKALDTTVGLGAAIDWDPNGKDEIHIIPRYSQNGGNGHDNDVRKFKLDRASFLFHFVNIYEEDGDVIVDTLNHDAWPHTQYGKHSSIDYRETGYQGGRMTRTVCFKDGHAETMTLSDRLMELSCVNPQYLGKPYRYAYMKTGLQPKSQEPLAVGKVDLKTGTMQEWTKGAHYIAGEPLFVPRPGSAKEDDGWILCFCYDGHTQKTDFVILDAEDIEKGPVATLHLKETIGHGFHGSWTEGHYGPEEGVLN